MTINVNELVEIEQARQTQKFGEQIHRTDIEWFTITAEEFGETAREVNDLYFTNTEGAEERMITEAIQTMACLKSWLEQRERREALAASLDYRAQGMYSMMSEVDTRRNPGDAFGYEPEEE